MTKKRKSSFESSLLLMLMILSIVVLNVPSASASETIYIRADGSIDPATAPIHTSDNVTYTFTDNINESIVIEKDNIIVDGLGYEVQGAHVGSGIRLAQRSNVTIKNVAIKAFEAGIYCLRTANSTITQNNITDNAYGIRLYYASNCTITANNITGNNNLGIWLYRSPSNILSRNHMTNNTNFGVYLYQSTSNNLFGNNITGNNIGVFIYTSSSNIISGSHITKSDYTAIWLYSTSKHNIISGNNLTTNDSGMYIDISSEYNTISRNNITSNIDSGIYLYSSSNNTLYNNNFTDNPTHVNSTESKNIWDKGYPTCGNYWSNYTGTDLYNGPYQNETGSDGIGDTPHTIDADNQDHYPLMNPWISISLQADFSYSPEFPWIGKNIIFNALATSTPSIFITNYNWTFGDGNQISTTTPIVTHAYAAEGVYEVNLTVTDIYGTSYSVAKLIEVILDDIPPTTLHNYDDLWHKADFTINLTATDTMPGSDVQETYYKINNGPQQNLSIRGQPQITTESANNTLEYWSVDNAGNDELPHKFLAEIKLDKTRPIANAGRTQTVSNGTEVTFNASASTDRNGIANYRWVFTDVTTRTLTGRNPTYTFTAPGTYTINLIVVDPAGNSATDTTAITVTPVEVFPWWIIIVAAVVIIAITIVALWRRETSHRKKTEN